MFLDTGFDSRAVVLKLDLFLGRSLMVFTYLPGVNFINILRAAFTRADPKSAKNTVKSSSFFAHLESAIVKAAGKMLMKLTPDRLELL